MYRLRSAFKITSEQQRSVAEITSRFRKGKNRQVLLGVTGSGKTFVMANIIAELDLPVLVLSPNKTLAAQLYQEFRGFFPENRVGYFISYYDYYQPEAYVPQRNLYIAKEVSINPDLERLRIDAARNILESRFTVIVASVSAIYNIGSPDDFFKQRLSFSRLSLINRDQLVRSLINLGYNRSEELIEPGKFRVRGDIVEIFPTSEEDPVRFVLERDRINMIEVFDAVTAESLKQLESVNIFPVTYFHYKQERVSRAIKEIRNELQERYAVFKEAGKIEYAERLKERTLFDIELLEQYGHCSGIENYSLYLSGRKSGDPPHTLLEFFGDDFLVIMDESHITVPQLQGMYEGDRSRKQKLVDYGFRLPSALDNRPLRFSEVDERLKKVLYVSATPATYEMEDVNGQVTELLIRPTGLLDPEIEIRRADSPIEDMLGEIEKDISHKNRVLITTLTKKMSERLTRFLAQQGLQCTYLHSEIKPLDRVKIIRKLRLGEIDVLVGINLLREGLDLPEVSLVIILDADREGYLRSERSLIQTFGRAARHVEGRVILYLREMTHSLQMAVRESRRRRTLQIRYNRENNIIPASIHKKVKDFYDDDYWIQKSEKTMDLKFKNREQIEREIVKLTAAMKKKSDALDFREAAVLRERIKHLKNIMIELL
jgi:excinuclease ABC subunit B